MSKTFSPNCMTSDGSTFYAHAVVNIGSSNPERTIVIAKSNTNPASFKDVTWSIYATAKEEYMGYLGGVNTMKSLVCIMDKQGVFTIISTSTKTNMASPETLGMGGYQYTPHADPSTGGTWTSIKMRTPYPWSPFGGGGLVLVPGAAGDKDVLMHFFPTSLSGNVIGVAVFDTELKSFSLLSNWTMPTSGHPYIIEPRGAQMHVLTYSIIGAKDPVLNRMSINPTAAPPANSSVAMSNFTLPEGCTSLIADKPQTCMFANQFYYMCRISSNANYLVSTDGTNKIGPVKTSVFNSYTDIYPIGPPEGPALWGMMANFTDYAGVVLSGDKIGEFQTLSSKMTISGLTGPGGVWNGGDSGGDSGSGDGSGLSPGAIAGIVGGVFILIISISNFCRICRKRSKRHPGLSRPTTPVFEDPDSLVPNITDVPEAKMECDALPMAPITAAPPMPLGTGNAGVNSGKDTGSSILPPSLLAPRPYVDTKVSLQAAHHQQQPPPSQSPQTQNTFEDGYQQGFQQALVALRMEQEQQQQQQELLRRTQNPQLRVTSDNPQSVPGTWSPSNSNTTTTTLASNNPQHYSQPPGNNPQHYSQPPGNNPQHYSQPPGNNPQYYPLPIPGSMAYQQHQQQQSQGYYQFGISTDDTRNPQTYNAGYVPLSPVVPGNTPLSPLPAYVSGSVNMSSPVPSYGAGGGSGGTPYTPSSGTSQAWTPGSTAYMSPVAPGSNHHPGAQGHNPAYHQ